MLNLDAYLSILRAVLVAIGTSLGTIGAVNADQWTAISGGIIAVVTVIWGVYNHQVVQPARIVTASSEAAKAVAGGASVGAGAATGASISGASNSTIADARTAAVTPSAS